MQFNRDEYVFLSRRGSVPRVSRAGPRSRPVVRAAGRAGRAGGVARRWRNAAVAFLAAVRGTRTALSDGRDE